MSFPLKEFLCDQTDKVPDLSKLHQQTWVIKDCDIKNKFEWHSDAFYHGHTLTKWHVELSIGEEIELYLCHHASEYEKVLASYYFDLQDIQNRFPVISLSINRTITFSGSKRKICRPFSCNYRRLSLILHVAITEVIAKTPVKPYFTQEPSLHSDIYRMWELQKFCDCAIRVRGKDIPVHRLIIAGVSPVFQDILEHNTLGKPKARIVIEDFGEDIIEHLVRFAYTRKEPDFESFSLDVCFDLLKAANKYGVVLLLSVISRYLISILSIENVAEILINADQQSVADLKESAINFICGNGVKLSEKVYLNKLRGKAELWEEIALRKLRS